MQEKNGMLDVHFEADTIETYQTIFDTLVLIIFPPFFFCFPVQAAVANVGILNFPAGFSATQSGIPLYEGMPDLNNSFLEHPVSCEFQTLLSRAKFLKS